MKYRVSFGPDLHSEAGLRGNASTKSLDTGIAAPYSIGAGLSESDAARMLEGFAALDAEVMREQEARRARLRAAIASLLEDVFEPPKYLTVEEWADEIIDIAQGSDFF